MRKTSEARLNQAARAGKAEGKRQAIAEKVSKQDNRLTFDTIFGQVNLTMPPDIAFQYETADPGGKLAIIKQFHDNAVDAGIRSGQQIVPRWQNSPAAQSLILNKILPSPLPTTPGEIIAPTAPPQITDERTRFEPYTPGSVGAEMAGILGRAVEGTPQYQALTSQRQLFPEVYTGVAAKFRQAGSNLENLLPVNPMLNFPAQFLESAADVADPNAGVGETIIGGASITPALWPYVKGGLVASNLLRAGSKFAPALEAGLNAAAREGIIGWSLLERKIRAKDIANILEKAGMFNEAGYFLRQTERADFIRRLQEDAKAWARKNGKNENEILELEEEFYKNLLRPVLNNYPPTGGGATGTLSSKGVGLTWEARRDEVNCSSEFKSIESCNIVKYLGGREVLFENLLAVRVSLDHNSRLEARPFGSEVNSTNAREEAKVLHSLSPQAKSSSISVLM